MTTLNPKYALIPFLQSLVGKQLDTVAGRCAVVSYRFDALHRGWTVRTRTLTGTPGPDLWFPLDRGPVPLQRVTQVPFQTRAYFVGGAGLVRAQGMTLNEPLNVAHRLLPRGDSTYVTSLTIATGLVPFNGAGVSYNQAVYAFGCHRRGFAETGDTWWPEDEPHQNVAKFGPEETAGVVPVTVTLAEASWEKRRQLSATRFFDQSALLIGGYGVGPARGVVRNVLAEMTATETFRVVTHTLGGLSPVAALPAYQDDQLFLQLNVEGNPPVELPQAGNPETWVNAAATTLADGRPVVVAPMTGDFQGYRNRYTTVERSYATITQGLGSVGYGAMHANLLGTHLMLVGGRSPLASGWDTGIAFAARVQVPGFTETVLSAQLGAFSSTVVLDGVLHAAGGFLGDSNNAAAATVLHRYNGIGDFFIVTGATLEAGAKRVAGILPGA